MPQILVRGLDKKTVERLKAQARSHRRSLQQEVKAVLEQAAVMLTMEEARDVAEAWHRRLAGRSFSDSAELIREDRDSR
jgi:antitoxin FitA